MAMLPGGMMPIVQLVDIIRSTTAPFAVDLLKALPADRLSAVAAEIDHADIARLLPAATPALREALLAAMALDQLVLLLCAQHVTAAVTLMTGLSGERLDAIASRLPAEMVAALLPALAETRQAGLLEAMEPASRFAALSRQYENEVAAALVRANTEISVPAGAPSGIVVVQGLSWRILVSARYGDDGRVAVPEAEDGAARMHMSGALAIVSLGPGEEAIRHCRQAQEQGRATTVVRWADGRDDGSLKRSLVSLFH